MTSTTDLTNDNGTTADPRDFDFELAISCRDLLQDRGVLELLPPLCDLIVADMRLRTLSILLIEIGTYGEKTSITIYGGQTTWKRPHMVMIYVVDRDPPEEPACFAMTYDKEANMRRFRLG